MPRTARDALRDALERGMLHVHLVHANGKNPYARLFVMSRGSELCDTPNCYKQWLNGQHKDSGASTNAPVARSAER